MLNHLVKATMSISSQTAIFGISFYQRFISPHKGYRCAHAVLHQGTSCSHAVKLMIAEQGVWQSWASIQQRFAECRAAALVLRRRYEDEEHEGSCSQRRKNRRRRDTCLDNCDLPCDCTDFDFNPCN